MPLFVLKTPSSFLGDGASSHLIVKKKPTILYLQLFWKFEIKLFKNNFKVSHIYTNYITFCLIDKNKFCYNTLKICCNTIDIFGNSGSINNVRFAYSQFHPWGTPRTQTHTCTHFTHLLEPSVHQGASHTHLTLQLSIVLQRTLCPPPYNSQVTDCLSF